MKLLQNRAPDFLSIVQTYKIPLLAAVVVLLLAVPYLGFSNYILRVFCLIFIYSVLTISLNIVTGYLGATSMGHAALFCVGAYAGAIASTRFGCGILVSILAAAAIGVLFGAVEGICTMKLSWSYMSVTTLAFAQVISMVAKNWVPVTNGTLGIKNIPKIELFGVELTLKNGGLYFFGLFLLILCILFAMTIIRSKFGRAFVAVRDDELSARMMGLNTRAIRVLGTTLSGALAGIAGCYYTFLTGYIDPLSFSFDVSMTILTMAILGGLASIQGSIIGAATLTIFPELLRSLNVYRYLFFGIILVLMMRLRPQGILGGVRSKCYKLPRGVVCVKRRTREPQN
jgi:branched-chain amino acid transport system permease protein